jgi:hypothetical protein
MMIGAGAMMDLVVDYHSPPVETEALDAKCHQRLRFVVAGILSLSRGCGDLEIEEVASARTTEMV